MIDCGSQTEPLTSRGSSLRRMLRNVLSRLQKFGGPARSAYTASSSQWIPANGLWCSCSMPSACPISCRAVPRSPGSVRSQPKFMVRSFRPTRSASLPTVDQEPSPSWNPMRNSASDRSPTSTNDNPMPRFCHSWKHSRTTSRCFLPPTHDTCRVRPVSGSGITDPSDSRSKKQ